MFEEFAIKGVDLTILLSDGDGRDWRTEKQRELSYLPPDRVDRVIYGVPDRNVECWLCADPNWLANELNVRAAIFSVDDPKGAFERTIEVGRDDKKEGLISNLVNRAPLNRWLQNPSFEDFYECARDLSQRLGCSFENLRDRNR